MVLLWQQQTYQSQELREKWIANCQTHQQSEGFSLSVYTEQLSRHLYVRLLHFHVYILRYITVLILLLYSEGFIINHIWLVSKTIKNLSVKLILPFSLGEVLAWW